MNLNEAKSSWAVDRDRFAALGAVLPDVVTYATDEMKADYTLAMDAVPAAQTSANSGIPAFLTTTVDPQVFEILFAPNKGAQILGEVRKGTWLDETAIFPTVESTGEVSSYGDFNDNGRTGVNMIWPQRQSYLFQTMKEYGDRELERAGLGRINFVAEIDKAAATVLNKFSNLTYFYGVAGLQNYGLLNDPSLPAALTPATKAATGTSWIKTDGTINATANEVFADIQSLVQKLIVQTNGLVDTEATMKLAMSPASAVAMTITNSFGITVADMVKKTFPNMTVETAVQYGVKSATNPQGVTGGNLVQLIASSVEGQDTGYCAYNEKMREHPIVRGTSSYRQKVTGGTWGAIIRQPFAIAQMLGV